jgi:hypothetical protein
MNQSAGGALPDGVRNAPTVPGFSVTPGTCPELAKESWLRAAEATEAWASRLDCHNFHRTGPLQREPCRRRSRIEVIHSLLSPGLFRVLFLPLLEEGALT